MEAILVKEGTDEATNRRTWIIVVSVIVTLPLLGFGALWYVASNMFNSDLDPSPAVVLPFAGFSSTDGLVVATSHHDGWLDEAADFVLVGSGAEIDRALQSAQFEQDFTSGIHVETATGFDASKVSGATSAEDTWRRPGSGPAVHHRLVRGRSDEDPTKELLAVLAFTT